MNDLKKKFNGIDKKNNVFDHPIMEIEEEQAILFYRYNAVNHEQSINIAF